VYISFFESFVSSYFITCVEKLSYMFFYEWKPAAASLKMPLASVVWVPMLVRTEFQSSSMQLISAMSL